MAEPERTMRYERETAAIDPKARLVTPGGVPACGDISHGERVVVCSCGGLRGAAKPHGWHRAK